MDPPKTNAETETEKKESSTSPTELLSSAQYLGQAAVSSFNKDPDNKVDKAKAAAAAEDLLEAAEQYGKLDKTSYGTYVDKAEGFLHQYSEPGATKETTEAEKVKTDAPAPEDGGAKEPEKKEGDSKPVDESGGGFGGALKMAGGLFK